ncbi:MAG: TonB-dependent receptor family protein, partial [Paramuribaculum sp.]|nr:TonB-dependent receptor family protein [Paramuribaculum sp.]
MAAAADSIFAINYTFAGRATNSTGEPQEFATYRIYSAADTLKPVTYGVTDVDGVFSGQLQRPGNYRAKVSVVGLKEAVREFVVSESKPTADLGTMECGESDNLLGEVTVTATRPLVVKEIDRIGYDVQADLESRTSNLDEVLRKVPLVSVEPDGTIKVKGSSNFKIYKNGRPNNSFTQNAKEIFKAIPASMIKRIEVITDPGAREDAEGIGAILNIVTVQGSSIKGMMANVGLGYSTQNNIPMPNLWGSAQIDKVTFSLYGGGNIINRRSSRSASESVGIYDESGNISRSDSRSRSKGGVTWWGTEASFELDTLNLFTLEFGGYYYGVDSYSEGRNSLTAPDGSPIYSYGENRRTLPMSYLDFNGSLSYQHSTRRRGETFTLSYMVSTTGQHSDSETEYVDAQNMPVSYDGILSNYKLNFIEHTFQANWCRPFRDIHTMEMGLKYIFRNNSSKTTTDYLGTDISPVTDFTHRTHIMAAFADYRVKLGRFSLRGGVRYEFSRLSARFADGTSPDFGSNLSDLVPNAAVSYDINDANNVKLSYTTRINRPGINYLNPAVTETPNSTSQGNPELGSARHNTLSLNYSLLSRKVTLDANAGYTFADNAIIDIIEVAGDHTYSGFANAGRNRSFDASAFVQWMAGSKTTVMFNLGANYVFIENPSKNISKRGWIPNGYTRITQRLPWKLSASLGAYYWGGSIDLYSRFQGVGISNLFYNLSLNRNFLKEDRLSVRLSIQNPFYPSRRKTKSETYNTSYRTATYNYNYNTTAFGVNISYRFGSMSSSVKKTAAKISNDDLV